MIAREIRMKTKRAGRRMTSVRTNSFQTRVAPQTHPAFGIPDSYQEWLSTSDGAAKEINEFYRA
jgi:hypothetical protein